MHNRKGGRPRTTAKRAAIALAYIYLDSKLERSQKIRWKVHKGRPIPVKDLNRALLRHIASGELHGRSFNYLKNEDTEKQIRRMIFHDDNPVTELLRDGSPYIAKDSGGRRFDLDYAVPTLVFDTDSVCGAAVLDKHKIEVRTDSIIVSGSGWVWRVGEPSAHYGPFRMKSSTVKRGQHSVALPEPT